MKLIYAILLGLMLSACSSMPKLKDFNKIGAGMSRSQVVDQLGDPKTSKMVDGREILEYDAKDDDESKPRIVVLEDREVIFYGKPSEYKRQSDQQATASHVTNTVSPVITVSPVFSTQPQVAGAQSVAAPQNIADVYNKGERNVSYHDVPELPQGAK